MTFLSPRLLWLLTAGVFVIVAYLLRMPRRRRPFPSVLILQAMARLARGERRKLRTALSFAMLFLAFLMICLGAGRPYVSKAQEGDRDHIVLLDVSASMKAAAEPSGQDEARGGVTRFEEARAQALRLLRSLPVGHRAMVVTLGEAASIAASFEHDTHLLDEVVTGLAARDVGTNWADAARLLREVLPAAHDPVCHVLTDGAGFDGDPWKDLADKAEFRYHALGAPVDNVAITAFRARTTFHSDRDFQIVAEVVNFSERPASVDFDLYLEDNIMDTRRLDLAAGGKTVEVFEQSLRVGGVLRGQLSAGEEPYADGLAGDNVAHDVVPSPRRPRVLIYTSEKSDFLQAALSADSNTLAYRQDPERYSPSYAADIIVFYNTELPDRLPPRDVIFINTRGAAMPVPVRKEFEDPLMRTWNRHHPLLNYISLSNLLIARAQGFATPGWAETLAETASGPLIVAGETPQRQLVFIGLDPRDSDLPFRAALPMLVANAVLWMKERPPDPDPVQPGQTYRIQLAEAGDGTLELRRPGDGLVSFHEVGDDGSVLVLDTRQAGVYRYRAAAERGAFAVNVCNARESRLAPAEALTLGPRRIERFAAERPVPVSWRLWPALAWVALAVLAVENSLYHKRMLF